MVRGQLISKLLLGPSLERALARANADLCTRSLVIVAGGEYVIEVVPGVARSLVPLLLPLLLLHHPLAGGANGSATLRFGLLLYTGGGGVNY